MIALAPYQERLAGFRPLQLSGQVLRVVGLAVVASGPAVAVGECCLIEGREESWPALVIGFREGELLLQPLGRAAGIRAGDRVVATGRPLEVRVGDGLVGRVVDALARPIDGRGPIAGGSLRPIEAEPPAALGRPPIEDVLETGIKAIDTCYTLGRGQRLGIFAGSGVGKSMLLGELARFARADVNVIALVGERGREVGEFIDKVLGPAGMARSVVIVATSDRPAVERMAAAATAHTIAEAFRDAGREVLLMMDSLTRYCHAGRDIGLAAGEPPTVRGYPPSVFANLPRLLERAGRSQHGSLTAIYTVLVDGDDETDPVADNVRAILDGHLFLSRRLAGQGLYPSIDPLLSVSRLLPDLATQDDQQAALEAREIWAEFERVRDLVEIGAYQQGADPRVDRAIALRPKLVGFLKQGLGETHTRQASLAALRAVLAAGAG